MQRGCVDTLQSCRRGEEDGKSTVTFGRFFIVPRPNGPLAGQGNCSSWGSSTVSRGTVIFRHKASHWLEVRSKNTLILLSAFSQIQTICFIPWIYPAAWGQGALGDGDVLRSIQGKKYREKKGDLEGRQVCRAKGTCVVHLASFILVSLFMVKDFSGSLLL